MVLPWEKPGNLWDISRTAMVSIIFGSFCSMVCQESAFIYTLEAPYTQGPTSLLVNTGASWMNDAE